MTAQALRAPTFNVVGRSGGTDRAEQIPMGASQPHSIAPHIEADVVDTFVVDTGAAMRRQLGRLVAVLAVVTVALFLVLAAGVQAGDSVRATDQHIVGQGESLWAIAEAHTAPGGDVRATIADIKALNDLDSSVILTGQALTVPAD